MTVNLVTKILYFLLLRTLGVFSAISNFPFGSTNSHGIKHLKKNVAILMQNQDLQQSLMKTNGQTNNIMCIHLTKNRHIINGLMGALESINDADYHTNLAINCLHCAKSFLLTVAEIDHRLN